MKKFFADFKNFISKGRVVDMAVGVVVGTAFSAIVNSLVNDIIMPPIGVAIGGVNFKDLKAEIKPAIYDTAGKITKEAVTWNYGNFIQTIINFLIIALCMFVILRIFMKGSGLVSGVIKESTSYKTVFTKEEIATFRKEGLKTKDIKAKAKLILKEKEAKEKLEKEHKDLEAKAKSTETVLQDIRALLIADAQAKNLDLDTVLSKETTIVLNSNKEE